MQDYVDVDAYLADSDRWRDEIAALRPILSGCGLTEAIKWGKPSYCLDDGETHVSGAKQAATRNRRIDKIVPRILAGKGLRDRPE